MHKERLMDMHVHSDNSPDGKHSPMFICEQAVEKNLRAVAFTDHCEIDSYYENKYNNMTFHSFFECKKAKVAFEGQLLVLTGIEIAQPLFDKKLSDKVISNYPFDIVLGSIHTPKGFNCTVKEIPYDEIDVYRFMKDYFAELTELCYYDKIDVLAHITCPMRRIQGKYAINFDYSKIKKETDELLKSMIENNKVLEINTSGLRQMMGRTMPEESLIRRYKELGGKNVTIGSDSHSAYDVGAGILEGMVIAKKCGFDKLTFFVGREKLEIENNL